MTGVWAGQQTECDDVRNDKLSLNRGINRAVARSSNVTTIRRRAVPAIYVRSGVYGRVLCCIADRECYVTLMRRSTLLRRFALPVHAALTPGPSPNPGKGVPDRYEAASSSGVIDCLPSVRERSLPLYFEGEGRWPACAERSESGE
jgi:hypothetical protein